MPSSVLWRTQLVRLLQIVLSLLSGRHPDACELCEVSRRVIHRDLETVILAGFPIEFHPESQGYRIAPDLSAETSRLDLRLVRSLAALPSYRVEVGVPSGHL